MVVVVVSWATSGRPKVVRTPIALYILTSKCASHHNAVHFFNIATSKSAPDLRCFDTFYFQMCSHHNGMHFFDTSTSQNAPKPRCFHTFSFKMCFVPQRCAILHLSSGQLATSAPAALASTFRHSGDTKQWKNTVFRDFPTFSHTCVVSLSHLLHV